MKRPDLKGILSIGREHAITIAPRGTLPSRDQKALNRHMQIVSKTRGRRELDKFPVTEVASDGVGNGDV